MPINLKECLNLKSMNALWKGFDKAVGKCPQTGLKFNFVCNDASKYHRIFTKKKWKRQTRINIS